MTPDARGRLTPKELKEKLERIVIQNLSDRGRSREIDAADEELEKALKQAAGFIGDVPGSSGATSGSVRARIEAQGFIGLDDQTLSRINYWLRLSPAICMVWTAIGTALQSAAVLWWLVPFAALGAMLPGHPFDVLYTYGFRYLIRGPRLPRYPFPRRMACLVATVMIAGAAWSFQTGRPLLGHVLGWTVVAAAFANVSIGFCVPSFLYGLVFGRPSSCAVSGAGSSRAR